MGDAGLANWGQLVTPNVLFLLSKFPQKIGYFL